MEILTLQEIQPYYHDEKYKQKHWNALIYTECWYGTFDACFIQSAMARHLLLNILRKVYCETMKLTNPCFKFMKYNQPKIYQT